MKIEHNKFKKPF